MTEIESEPPTTKVERLLQEALAETDLAVRTRLIGKAAYWSRVAEKQAAPPLTPGGDWPDYARARHF